MAQQQQEEGYISRLYFICLLLFLMRISGSTSGTITYTNFTSNFASRGGGMTVGAFATPTMQNCFFSENTADTSGGGAESIQQSAPIFKDCVFERNYAKSSGVGFVAGGNSTFT